MSMIAGPESGASRLRDPEALSRHSIYRAALGETSRPQREAGMRRSQGMHIATTLEAWSGILVGRVSRSGPQMVSKAILKHRDRSNQPRNLLLLEGT